MILFEYEPGSGPALPFEAQRQRLHEIRETIQATDYPPEDQQAIARRAIWLYIQARPEQIPPGGTWDIWALIAGRGAGKTRTGAETIIAWAQSIKDSRWALVSATLTDVRETMIEGESGILSIISDEALWGGSRDKGYNSGRPELRLSNGARLRGYSSEKPDRLRGPQFHGWWGDEPASWKDARIAPEDPEHLNTTFSNMRLSTRLRAPGWDNKGILTGTPKNVGLISGRRDLPGIMTGYEGVSIEKMNTRENLLNLSDFYRGLVRRLDGTRLGRQELNAELLTDVLGSLVRDSWIVVSDPPPLEEFTRIGVAIDPAGSHRKTSDETGIIVGGLDRIGRVWILDDVSGRYTPAQWRDLANAKYEEYRADAVIGEVNFGGDLVEQNMKALSRPPRFVPIRASRGKAIRAEPIAGLYEVRVDGQGRPLEEAGERIRHARFFPELVDQWTSWIPHAPTFSPDRLDAEVHLVTWLLEVGDAWEGSDLLSGLGTYQ